ncbi:MAG: glycosyl hydrolase family 18 protein, partial [Bacteroidetes bacterium]|nr:glycosyl hydrolase family 18 protein [Bacteroidota bacterium]
FGSSFLALTNPVVDLYFIMLYDYYWSGSSTAGPVAPLSVANYNVTKSIDYYLGVGYPASKLIAGYPYYGLDWPVVSDARMAAATGSASSRKYSVVKNDYIDTIGASNKFFDATYSVPWYRYQTAGGWRQTWYDDSASLALKYDLVASRNLGGTGMWALGYDGTEPELWRLLKAKFAEPVIAGRSVFDDFEASVGRFDRSPTYSGSTTGIATSSYAVFTNDVAKSGLGALLVSLVDNASSTSDWNVRLLSASGNAAGNVAVTMPGRIGFWLKTATASPSSELGIAVDDGATLLRSPRLSVINDGEWHFYEWDLEETGWKVFTTGVDTVVVGPTVTLDAVMFYALNGSSAWTSFVDEVGYAPTTEVGKEVASVPAEFELENNWPNPFNPTTHFGVRIADYGWVKLSVFDQLGREIAVLVNEELSPGRHTVSWDASGRTSGVYYCRMMLNGKSQVRKIVLMK